MKKFFLYAVCFPNDVLMLVFLLFSRIFWGKSFYRNQGLWVVLDEKSWLGRTWGSKYSGVCLGHGGLLVATVDEVVVHELVHLEQHQVSMLKSFLHASVVFIVCAIFSLYQIALITSFVIWATGYLFFLISGWLVALLRSENPYSGSSHEEAAYAIAEDYLRRKDGYASRRIFK
jgi:hypothetical protein